MKFKESKSIYLQDFIIYPVGYLQVNGFTFFKFHSKRNLGLTTCERVKSW